MECVNAPEDAGAGNRAGNRDTELRQNRVDPVLAADDAATMMWGDVGKLYFMIRPDDLQARRFDKARFTWQCS